MAGKAGYVAVDIGADSGRVAIGRFAGGRIRLEPVHRFANGGLKVLDHLYWDVLRLFEEVKTGLRQCAGRDDYEIRGIGISTWGVDSALLDGNGELVGLPYCYRDPRTTGMMERAFARMPREEIFRHTGIQFMPLNSLYQLLATAATAPAKLQTAETFLMIPDLFNFWLTGCKSCELTIASTSQCLDVRRDAWSRPVLQALGLPVGIFPDLRPPGTILAPLHESVAGEVGLPGVPVIATASHDTAAAVAATPARATDSEFVYINAGTWSIVGVEGPEPVTSEKALAFNLTNERGMANTYMLRKNIMGLWSLQECRRTWAEAGTPLDYDGLTDLGEQATPFGPLIEPDHESFLSPGDMPAKIAAYCRQTGQTPPADVGATVRCILESLALKYRWVIDSIEEVRGREIQFIHLMGGGSKSRLLCRLTADLTGRLVLAGPDEATSTGNLMVQAIASGELASVAEGREIVRNSFELATYEPRERARSEDLYRRFLKMKESSSTLL